MSNGTNADAIREEWLNRLNVLISEVQSWCESKGCATRVISIATKGMDGRSYQAPALLIQDNALRMILQGIGEPNRLDEGTVDLYVMPTYDDIARIYSEGGKWHVYYALPAMRPDDEPRLWDQAAFEAVLEGMKHHAVE
jgi:hypothetical protein